MGLTRGLDGQELGPPWTAHFCCVFAGVALNVAANVMGFGHGGVVFLRNAHRLPVAGAVVGLSRFGAVDSMACSFYRFRFASSPRRQPCPPVTSSASGA